MTAPAIESDTEILNALDFTTPCDVTYVGPGTRCDQAATHQTMCRHCKHKGVVCDDHAKQCYKPIPRTVRCGGCGRFGAQVVTRL